MAILALFVFRDVYQDAFHLSLEQLNKFPFTLLIEIMHSGEIMSHSLQALLITTV